MRAFMLAASVSVFVLAAPAFVPSALAQSAAPAPGAHFDRAEWSKHRCVDHYAREAGHLAALEVKLNLTAAQKPLWEKWRQASLASAESERNLCVDTVPKRGAKPTALDREALAERHLSTKLEGLHAAQPMLATFYQSLTPAQRTTFDHSHGHRHGMRHARGHHHGGFGGNHWHHAALTQPAPAPK